MSCVYSNEKREAIKSLDNLTIYRFLDQIEDCKSILNNEFLDPFVPTLLKNSRDNSKKYGLQTRERFVNALKGELNSEGFFRKQTNKISPEDWIFSKLEEILYLWAKSNFLYFDKIFTAYKESRPKNIEVNYHDKDFFEFLLVQNQKYLVSRETLCSYYRFCSFVDEEIEKKLKVCKSRLDILKNIKQDLKNNTSNEDLELLKKENKEIKNELESTKKDFLDIQNINETLKIENENLRNEVNTQKEDNYELQYQIENLSKKIQNIDNTDIEKMKESLIDKLKDKDYKLKELEYKLEELTSLESKNEKLMEKIKDIEKYKTFNVRELRNCLNDIEYTQILKEIILSDKNTLNFVANALNLKEEIINNDSKNVAATNEEVYTLKDEITNLTELRNQLLDDIANLEQQKFETNKNNKYQIEQNVNQEYKENNEEFKLNLKLFETNQNEDLQQVLIENDIFDEDEFEDLRQSKIIISNQYKDYENWMKAQTITFKPLIVAVDYDWTSYKEWFGYFDNSIFKPSTTLIADYYKFLVENQDIPFGVVVFKDFNKIIPEFYLESFFEKIKTNGYIDLIHPNSIVSDDDNIYKRIEKEDLFDRLKFVLIKSQDEDAFDIKDSFVKNIGAVKNA